MMTAIAAWSILTMPDQRTAGQKIGNAIDALPQGPDKAARQLEDRTLEQRLSDALKDARERIRQDIAPDNRQK
jgi:hypothetical protein